jgi:hypothetical protein
MSCVSAGMKGHSLRLIRNVLYVNFPTILKFKVGNFYVSFTLLENSKL